MGCQCCHLSQIVTIPILLDSDDRIEISGIEEELFWLGSKFKHWIINI